MLLHLVRKRKEITVQCTIHVTQIPFHTYIYIYFGNIVPFALKGRVLSCPRQLCQLRQFLDDPKIKSFNRIALCNL